MTLADMYQTLRGLSVGVGGLSVGVRSLLLTSVF